MMTYRMSAGSRPSRSSPPMINSSELYGKTVSMMMMPSLVVRAHDV